MSPPTSLTSEVRGETMGNPDSCFDPPTHPPQNKLPGSRNWAKPWQMSYSL